MSSVDADMRALQEFLAVATKYEKQEASIVDLMGAAHNTYNVLAELSEEEDAAETADMRAALLHNDPAAVRRAFGDISKRDETQLRKESIPSVLTRAVALVESSTELALKEKGFNDFTTSEAQAFAKNHAQAVISGTLDKPGSIYGIIDIAVAELFEQCVVSGLISKSEAGERVGKIVGIGIDQGLAHAYDEKDENEGWLDPYKPSTTSHWHFPFARLTS